MIHPSLAHAIARTKHPETAWRPLRWAPLAWINSVVTDPDFLTELHARFEAPRGVVVDLIEREARSSVRDLQRLTLGDENEVYRAVLGAGAVYARIRRPGEGTFGSEVWAMDQARSAGIPIPHVLAVQEIITEAGPRSVMLIAESAGRQLSELLPGLSGQQRNRALINVGRILTVLHSVTTPGVDRPNADGNWPNADRARQAFIDERTGQRSHLVTAGLNATEVHRVIEQIGKSLDTPATTDPVLCHGDLHAGHVFVDNDFEVCGVIDWGGWHGGSQIGELAAISMLYKPSDVETILNSYGGDFADDPTFAQRIALAVINQALGHIAWHESIGNVHGTAHYVRVLRAALAEIGIESGSAEL